MVFKEFLGRIVICWIGCWLSILSTHAQIPTDRGPFPTHWTKVEIPNGPYPKSKVTSLMQDHYGFIWIGGVDGLFRYDGNEYVHYFHRPNDSSSLSSSRVKTILEDANGDIWVGTFDGGLNLYRREWEDFIQIGAEQGMDIPPSTAQIKDLLLDRAGKLWVATTDGLYWTEPQPSRQNTWRLFGNKKGTPEYLAQQHVSCLAQDSMGNIWIATQGGYLSRWGKDAAGEGQQFALQTFDPDPTGNGGIPSKILMDLQVDPSGTLWVGHTSGASFSQLKGRQVGQVQFQHIAEERMDPGRSRTGVEQICIDPWGHEWLLSSWGIHRLLPNGEIYSHHPDGAGLKSKGFNAQYAMLVDQNGGFWLGCQEGLYRSPSGMGPFRHLPIRPEKGSGRVTAIHQDRFGQYWLGLEENGLVLLDAGFRPYLRHTSAEKDAQTLLGNFVMHILEDSEGEIWVATYGGGLHRAKVSRLADGRVSDLKMERQFQVGGLSNLEDPYIYNLLEDGDGAIWAATFYGIWKKEKGAKSFRKWTVEVANDLAKDANGDIWAATDKGLFRIRHGSDSLERVPSPPNSVAKADHWVLTVVEFDGKGRMWTGGPNGLVKWPHGDDPGLWLQNEDGESEMGIRAMETDGKGKFWCSTANHLLEIDPETGAMRRFTHADGLLNTGYALRSSFRDGIGHLYFGGEEGLTWFHPDSLRPTPFDPPVFFTRFLLHNEWILPARTNPTPLPTSILLMDTLFIRPEHKVFTLEFAALDFRFQHTLRYRYRLIGFDGEWRTTGSGEHSLTYTNLDPGIYTLEVAPLSPNEVQGSQIGKMVIVVQPPWWQTGWAKMLYVLLGLVLLVIVWRLRVKALRREITTQARIAQARSEERERVRSASSKDFHDEAGNRLTRLSLYTALLRQQTTEAPQSQETIDRIDENIQSLTSGMRDFIWVLDPQYDSLHELLLRLAQFGEELVAPSAIRFHFRNRLPENLPFVPDARVKRQLLLIFKEAMHNAVRHGQPAQMHLEADLLAEAVIISLTDDGKGFEMAALGRMNGLRNMRERAEAIGAKWEVNATPGKGTVVRVILPMKK